MTQDDHGVNHSVEINTVDAPNAGNVAVALCALRQMGRSIKLSVRFGIAIPLIEPQTGKDPSVFISKALP